MVDTHAHIITGVVDDVTEQIQRINSLTLDKIINVGLDAETNLEVLTIAQQNSKFYAALGIHPLYIGSIDSIYQLSLTHDFSKVVALGETGLDYDTEKISILEQTTKFIETIELANYLKLPVIVHANRMNRQALDIIRAHPPKYSFVFHCFEPDLEILDEIMKLGGYISVASPITSPKAKKSLEVVKRVPIDRLLIEEDFPYMIRNGYDDGKNIFNRIKSLRELTHGELETILDNNAKRLFKKLK